MAMGMARRAWAWWLAGSPTVRAQADPPTGVEAKLAAAILARSGVDDVTTRDQAVELSVVNRARDIICGVLSTLPLTRIRTIGDVEEDLGAGWLGRPDPDHNRGWFVANITDDLFFRGMAFARISARDNDDQAVAMQWMPWSQIRPIYDLATPGAPIVAAEWTWAGGSMDVAGADLVVFESPLLGVLQGGGEVLTTAARLNDSAARFASNEIPAGWLKQSDGEDLTPAELLDMANLFAQARSVNTIAALNRYVEYQESTMAPDRLQLVEGRSYQDAAMARVCNVPNFAVGVGVPNESMTYKTALTARLDLLDFGLAPYVECWAQTLSSGRVTPRGTRVVFDLEPFLRTSQLATGPGLGNPADVPVPVATPPGGSTP